MRGGHSGSYAARLVRSSPGDLVLNDSPDWVQWTTAGRTCSATAWVKGPPGAVVKIRFREYQGGLLAAYQAVPTVLSSNAWRLVTVSMVVAGPGDTLDLNIYGQQFAAGVPLLVDDVIETCS